jgi:hypothetical protein
MMMMMFSHLSQRYHKPDKSYEETTRLPPSPYPPRRDIASVYDHIFSVLVKAIVIFDTYPSPP